MPQTAQLPWPALLHLQIQNSMLIRSVVSGSRHADKRMDIIFGEQKWKHAEKQTAAYVNSRSYIQLVPVSVASF
jgi:hypothetical protein